LAEYISDIKATTGLGEVTVAGAIELLKEPRGAIFNSRQGKTPDSGAQWLRFTSEVVKLLTEHKAAIISSLGMTTWEVVTYLTGALEGNLIILLPDIEPEAQPKMARSVIEDFALDKAKVLFIFPDRETQPEKNYLKLPKKDFWIASMADRIYPVSVRPGGNHTRILELFNIIPGRVSQKFRIDYEKPTGSGFHPEQLPPLVKREEKDWEYLTHWTRTSIEPWLKESKAEFYRSMFDRTTGYSHDGYNTLCRILQDKTIFASDKLIRGGYKTVSLTEAPVWDILQQIHWRSPLQRWTFEPYGIAIRKEKMAEAGVKKVLYGLDYQYRFCLEEDKPYFQAYDLEGYDWRKEREWRYVGDLNLDQFEPEDTFVIVKTFDEAEQLGEWSPFPVKYWEMFNENAG